MQRMMRWMIAAIIVIVIAVYLSSRVSEKPLTRHEKPVSLDALAK